MKILSDALYALAALAACVPIAVFGWAGLLVVGLFCGYQAMKGNKNGTTS